MESNVPSLEQADLDRLNDKDKAELRQFITNEQQRTRIQGRKRLRYLPPSNPSYRPLPLLQSAAGNAVGELKKD